jgi:chemotaxis protein histidine kinase CheA/CheY-like chemotaxis protein
MTPEQQQQRIMGYFIEEAKDHLQTIEQGVLNLQEVLEDQESINELFRAAHSIKGGSAMLGVSSIQHISHRLEDYFKILKEDTSIRVDEKLTSLFLAGFDRLQDLLEHLEINFRISDELSASTISDLAPVFSQLEAHLNQLANQDSTTFTVLTEVAEPKVNRQAIVFQNGVTAKLRDMLQAFKQVDDASSRQQLQSICGELYQFGEEFQITSWCQLIKKAKQAIAANQNSYRTLAPVLIKDIKQAQDLVMTNRELEILESPQLLALIPYVPPISIEEDDEISTIFTTGSLKETDTLGLDAISEPDNLTDSAASEAIAAEVYDTRELAVDNLGWQGDSDSQERRVDGPKVGASEMKSLASLFENEDVDLESAWEDIETSETQISEQDDSQAQSDQDDLTDLLNSSKEERFGLDSTDDDDLTGLFGNEFGLEPQLENSDTLFPDDMGMGDSLLGTSVESDLFPDGLDDEEVQAESLVDPLAGLAALDEIAPEVAILEQDLFLSEPLENAQPNPEDGEDELDLFGVSEGIDLSSGLIEDALLLDSEFFDAETQPIESVGDDQDFDLPQLESEGDEPFESLSQSENLIEFEGAEDSEFQAEDAEEFDPFTVNKDLGFDVLSDTSEPIAAETVDIFEDLGFEEDDSLGLTSGDRLDSPEAEPSIFDLDVDSADNLDVSSAALTEDFADISELGENQIVEASALPDFLIEDGEVSDFLRLTNPEPEVAVDLNLENIEAEAFNAEIEILPVTEPALLEIGNYFGEVAQSPVVLSDDFWSTDLGSDLDLDLTPDAIASQVPTVADELNEFFDADDVDINQDSTSDQMPDQMTDEISDIEDSVDDIGESLSDFTDSLDLTAFDPSFDLELEPEILETSDLETPQAVEGGLGEAIDGISAFGDIFDDSGSLELNLDLDSEPASLIAEDLGLDQLADDPVELPLELVVDSVENPLEAPDAEAFAMLDIPPAAELGEDGDLGLGDFFSVDVAAIDESVDSVVVNPEDEDFGLGDFLELGSEELIAPNSEPADVADDFEVIESEQQEDNTFADLISTSDLEGSETTVEDFFVTPVEAIDDSGSLFGDELDQPAIADLFDQAPNLDDSESGNQDLADIFEAPATDAADELISGFGIDTPVSLDIDPDLDLASSQDDSIIPDTADELIDSFSMDAPVSLDIDPDLDLASSQDDSIIPLVLDLSEDIGESTEEDQSVAIASDLDYDFGEFDDLIAPSPESLISPEAIQEPILESSFDQDLGLSFDLDQLTRDQEAEAASISVGSANDEISEFLNSGNGISEALNQAEIETSSADNSEIDNFAELFELEDQSDSAQFEVNQAETEVASEIDLEGGIFDEFDDLEAMLGQDSTETTPNSLFSQSNGASDDGFDELDALLGAPATNVTSGSALPAQSSSDFGDLEQLLNDTYSKDVGPVITRPKRQERQRKTKLTETTMRVDVRHLDSLNNLVGELVVNRNLLEQDQERLQQFINNLLHQVQQLSEVSQRMRDQYDRSLLESSLMAGRTKNQSVSFDDISREFGDDGDDDESNVSDGFEGIEFDRYNTFHILSQEIIELIVRVRESASDIQFVVTETEQVTRQLGTITTQIQDDLKQSRMVPFAQIADRLPRGVRERSIKSGKQAELEVFGRETLIDKAILEQLTDPLTHLVNNAIDHGLEDPGTRQSGSKAAMGKITVRAYHQGNQTVISIGDDGAGINPDRVKQSAVSKGVRSQSEVSELSDNEVYDLLFEAGFSTKTQADEFSGRGVGLDVVKSSLDDIRGSMYIESAIGKGTTFTIRLPLTLSISKAMFCISDRARIAFPVDGFEDMIEVPQSQIQLNSKGQPCLPWRDNVLPFQHLSNLLAYNRHISRSNIYGKQDNDEVCIIILRNEGNYLALQVDQFLGEYEIVIKQLEGPIPKPVGIAGATVLGDGRVMAIANVLELFDIASGRLRPSISSTPVLPPDDEFMTDPTVLIVDDSITVRELLSLTFAKVGYRVEQARDGQDAWEKLRAGLPCDLIFCDIEMPRMDGLDLLSRLQKEPELSKIPVAMLTSRGADRHRQTAIQLGAKGYFTKPYLEEELLSASQRMLKGEVLVTL